MLLVGIDCINLAGWRSDRTRVCSRPDEIVTMVESGGRQIAAQLDRLPDLPRSECNQAAEPEAVDPSHTVDSCCASPFPLA